MTSTVLSHAARSAVVIESPFGATSSQCRPLIAIPAFAHASRTAARSEAGIR